ncbi:hypothetical protein GCM10009839_03780 [Catenulispora yoronensis]|uniref:Uncharacterized protein n=1 Tax=Catenulispora yoronensis TaxID=450799 RepID=A0ABP5F1P9_9ACTN
MVTSPAAFTAAGRTVCSPGAAAGAAACAGAVSAGAGDAGASRGSSRTFAAAIPPTVSEPAKVSTAHAAHATTVGLAMDFPALCVALVKPVNPVGRTAAEQRSRRTGRTAA